MSTPLNLLQRLLQRPDDAPSALEDEREYSVDELAREGGTTVRNLRAYQDAACCRRPSAGAAPGCISPATCAACG